jgi:hypothetical protein
MLALWRLITQQRGDASVSEQAIKVMSMRKFLKSVEARFKPAFLICLESPDGITCGGIVAGSQYFGGL